MKKIVTVTLNPAFDFHYFMDSFEVGRENYVTRSLCYAAGKGVNVSRALHSLGIKSMSYVILGEQNGDEFEKMLRSDGMDFTPLYTEGSVRKNITLHHENGCETRVSLDDFWVGQDVLDELERRLKNAVDEQTLLSFSGRLPRGLSEENAVHLLEGLKSSGARLLLDCNSLSGKTLKRINPWLIKPNEDEAAWLIGRKISDADDAANAAFELVKNGVAGE
ncbi:MAG: hypothetical protein J6B12_02295, partial [Clostridia bacterium]|nr:hypothetical protein [Clostridia bacterium]